jgi:hypothetical protein
MKRPLLWVVGIAVSIIAVGIAFIYGTYQQLVQYSAELHPPLDVRDRWNARAALNHDGTVWLLELVMGMPRLRRRMVSRLEVCLYSISILGGLLMRYCRDVFLKPL